MLLPAYAAAAVLAAFAAAAFNAAASSSNCLLLLPLFPPQLYGYLRTLYRIWLGIPRAAG